MIFQMIATTIGGSTIGTRKTVRIVSSSFDGLSSNNAIPSPISSCSTTVTDDNSTCTHTDRTNSGELNAC